MLLSDNFDAFNREYGGTDQTTGSAYTYMNEVMGSTYKIVNRIAIFAMVIAVILLGISFIINSGNKNEISQNKTALVRILFASAGIFAAVGIISLVVKLAI